MRVTDILNQYGSHCYKTVGRIIVIVFAALLFVLLRSLINFVPLNDDQRNHRPDDIVSNGERGSHQQSPDEQTESGDADYRLVFIGNSHSSVGSPFDHLQKMIRARDDKPTVSGQSISVDFLDSLEDQKATYSKPEYAVPTILVLQGQKISMSGRYLYSTKTATDIARIFSEKGTRVLMFAEWGQYGVEGDGARIHAIYEQIASAANADRETNTPVEVAPVGLVWDQVLKEFPNVRLHSSDGNHSNELGGIVTGIAFYCWCFDELPPENSLPQEDQVDLRKVSLIALDTCRKQKAKRIEESPRSSVRINCDQTRFVAILKRGGR